MNFEFELRDLRVTYHGSKSDTIDNVSLGIGRGSLNVILGQNGSGKSTLLRCLAGLQIWQDGDILRQGRSRNFDYKDFNQGLVLVSEDLVFPRFKLTDIAKTYRSVWPHFDEEVFQRLLAYGDISEKKTMVQLSRGQKILVQFAFGLATKPTAVLVDEGTAALDPYVRVRIATELVRHWKEHQATVVLATNIATEFQSLNPNVVLLQSGRVYLSGNLSEVRKKFLKVIAPSLEHASATNHGFVEVVENVSGGLTLIGLAERASALPSDFVVDRRTITLEEIFVFLSDRRAK